MLSFVLIKYKEKTYNNKREFKGNKNALWLAKRAWSTNILIGHKVKQREIKNEEKRKLNTIKTQNKRQQTNPIMIIMKPFVQGNKRKVASSPLGTMPPFLMCDIGTKSVQRYLS